MQDKLEFLAPEIWYVILRKCTPSWRIFEQQISSWNITYLIKGNARYTIDGAVYDLKPGDLLCLPPGAIRKAITYTDHLMHCFSVDFNLMDMKGKRADLSLPVISHLGLNTDIINLFHELFFTWVNKEPTFIIKTGGLFLMLLARFFEMITYHEDSKAMDFRIHKVTRYIAQHYAEKLTVAEMAEMVGLNTHYFGALFIKETKLTLHRYLTRVRVKNAENMLKSGEYSVEGVADVCGFADVAHFYKQFKAMRGVPPSYCIPKKHGYGKETGGKKIKSE
ncbi:hypothetical protein AGMMS4952_12630 [Spirochaetia bacterium]|nr:hypothetical protein AGMMS4952_12630 [Spirochaetia bacterium]